MIDSHNHTFYSKHAVGTVDDLVRASIQAGVTILTITDHAPFPVDKSNRLFESELEQYFIDIDKARTTYRDEILILSGLELDYMPGTEEYTQLLLDRYPLDFSLGSIHYVSLSDNQLVKVWELEKISNSQFLERYFNSLKNLVESGLFDAVGHGDCLLRGIPESQFLSYLEPLLSTFVKANIAWELNASGLRKSVLDTTNGLEVKGQWSYPSRTLLGKLSKLNVHFTIGSDAHNPQDAGSGISELMNELSWFGLHHLSYFVQRKRLDVPIQDLKNATKLKNQK